MQRQMLRATARVVTLTLHGAVVACAHHLLLLLLLRVHSGTIEGSEFLMAFFKLGREVMSHRYYCFK
jgi:hypothetical protein